MSINFRFPNITGGTEAEQLTQIRSYLHQLVEQLNWAMSLIESGSGTVSKTGSTQANSSEIGELKSSLVKLSNSVSSTYSRLNNKIEKQIEYAAGLNSQMNAILGTQGWYMLGVASGDACGAFTLTVGGTNEASPAMVDIATQNTNARVFLRLPSLSDDLLSRIGLIQESDNSYGVYAYYNRDSENQVYVNIHTHMGTFIAATWEPSDVSEDDMLAVISLKE